MAQNPPLCAGPFAVAFTGLLDCIVASLHYLGVSLIAAPGVMWLVAPSTYKYIQQPPEVDPSPKRVQSSRRVPTAPVGASQTFNDLHVLLGCVRLGFCTCERSKKGK